MGKSLKMASRSSLGNELGSRSLRQLFLYFGLRIKRIFACFEFKVFGAREGRKRRFESALDLNMKINADAMVRNEEVKRGTRRSGVVVRYQKSK